MRILQVTPAFPPSAHGGISTHVGLLSKGLASLGHRVSVATTNRYDSKRVMPFSGLRYVDGAQVYYARAHWPGRYFFAPRVLTALADWLPRSELVHVHDTRTFVGLAAYTVSRQSTVPYVVTCHGSLSPRVGDTKLKAIHDRVVGIGLLRKASRIIALNKQEMKEIAEFGIPADRVTIVPNTLPFDVRSPARLARPVKEEETERTILFLGRIHPIKGIDRLIDAFVLVREHHPSCKLVIVGQDYGAQESLEKKVRDLRLESKVEFPGPMYGDEKTTVLREADVLVLPSYKETFPLVVLEAFSEGVPVVTTENSGMAPDLAANGAALMASSPEEFADAIERCLYDSEVARKLRGAGFHLLTTTYSWDAAMRKLEETYENVIAEGCVR